MKASDFFVWILLIYYILTYVVGNEELKTGSWYSSRYGDTDYIDHKKSGLLLFVDQATGCHYIKTNVFDSLTPRLDKDGKVICEYQQQEIYYLDKDERNE